MAELPVLVSARLRLRPLRADDREALAVLFREPESSRLLSADLTDEHQLAAMHERRLADRGTPGTGHWIAESTAGAVVGLLHLRDSWELPGDVAEIGWYLDPSASGAGYATEAAARLLDYGTKALGLPAIWALIHVDNAPSRRVAERLGMRPVGRAEHYGAPHDEYVTSP